jgi:hypothetical protein
MKPGSEKENEGGKNLEKDGAINEKRGRVNEQHRTDRNVANEKENTETRNQKPGNPSIGKEEAIGIP